MLPKRLNLLIWPVGKEVCEQTGSDNNITYIKKEIYLVADLGFEPRLAIIVSRLWALHVTLTPIRNFLFSSGGRTRTYDSLMESSSLWDWWDTNFSTPRYLLSSKWDSNPQPSPWQGDYLTNWYITASGAGPAMQQGIIPHIFQIYYTSDILTVQTS